MYDTPLKDFNANSLTNLEILNLINVKINPDSYAKLSKLRALRYLRTRSTSTLCENISNDRNLFTSLSNLKLLHLDLIRYNYNYIFSYDLSALVELRFLYINYFEIDSTNVGFLKSCVSQELTALRLTNLFFEKSSLVAEFLENINYFPSLDNFAFCLNSTNVYRPALDFNWLMPFRNVKSLKLGHFNIRTFDMNVISRFLNLELLDMTNNDFDSIENNKWPLSIKLKT